jgi:hypothetical protein
MPATVRVVKIVEIGFKKFYRGRKTHLAAKSSYANSIFLETNDSGGSSSGFCDQLQPIDSERKLFPGSKHL